MKGGKLVAKKLTRLGERLELLKRIKIEGEKALRVTKILVVGGGPNF